MLILSVIPNHSTSTTTSPPKAPDLSEVMSTQKGNGVNNEMVDTVMLMLASSAEVSKDIIPADVSLNANMADVVSSVEDTTYDSSLLGLCPFVLSLFKPIIMSSILYWNDVRGAADSKLPDIIQDLRRIYKFNILVISEPRISGDKALKVVKSLGFSSFTIEDATGFSGGLWLLWDDQQVKLEVVDSNFQSITSLVTDSSNKQWFFTTVYASPDHALREELWVYLDAFNSPCTIPWLITGDFNELISDADKQGGRAVLGGGSFASWVDRNYLIDLGYIGADFTWKGTRNGEEILERLDRGLCNISWRHEFPDAFVQHLARLKSDHCPIFISLESAQFPSPTLKPFRFEAMWLNHSGFGDFTKQNWCLDDLPISSKVCMFTEAVKKWNVEVYGNIFKRKRRLIARLAGIQKVLCRRNVPFLVNLEKELTKEYHELLSSEEVFWKQKSTNLWLREGDKNTKFIHLSTIIRRRRNKIEGLEDEFGTWKTKREDLHITAVNYFKGLFRKKTTLGVSDVIPNLFDLDELSREVSELEIKNCLFSIGGLKAPGPDGIPAKFF